MWSPHVVSPHVSSCGAGRMTCYVSSQTGSIAHSRCSANISSCFHNLQEGNVSYFPSPRSATCVPVREIALCSKDTMGPCSCHPLRLEVESGLFSQPGVISSDLGGVSVLLFVLQCNSRLPPSSNPPLTSSPYPMLFL